VFLVPAERSGAVCVWVWIGQSVRSGLQACGDRAHTLVSVFDGDRRVNAAAIQRVARVGCAQVIVVAVLGARDTSKGREALGGLALQRGKK
jgi:2-C-methyl-D-erythritol 4-phosphate cytidylyltransferase